MIDQSYMNGEYLKKNPSWHVEDSIWKARQIIDMLCRNDIQPKSICDVGCGAGEILNQLYLQMPEDTTLSGYEVSPQSFELCKERAKKRLNFYLKDFFQERDVFFDLVLCIDVLEHLEDYFSFLRNLKGRGRYKIFHVPLDISVQTVFRGSPILRARDRNGHLHYFTKEVVIETLKDTSYKILDYFYTAGSIDLPASLSRTFLARLPRRALFALSEDMAVRILGGYSLLILTE